MTRLRRAGIVLTIVTTIVALFTGTVLTGSPASAAAFECNDVGAVVIVGGTNNADASHQIGVQDRYRGEGREVLIVDYPGNLWPLGSPGFDANVAMGVAATERLVADYQAACGDKPVAIVGFSLGARVAGDVLNKIATGDDVDENGVSCRRFTGQDGESYCIRTDGLTGELYSDPRRDGDRNGRGIELALFGVIPGLTMSGKRRGGFGDLPVTTYCIAGDGICDVPDLLHDPFGAIASFIGYFTRHGYYPFRMYAPVTNQNVWLCDQQPPEDVSTTSFDCFIDAPSTVSDVRKQIVNELRSLVGLPPRDVIDFWSLLPSANDVLPGVTVAKLQPLIRPVLQFLPQLPDLGYGGQLPDLFVFTGLLDGILSLDTAKVGENAKKLAGSLLSIVAMPVVFADRWGRRILRDLNPASRDALRSEVLPTDGSSRDSSSRHGTAGGPDLQFASTPDAAEVVSSDTAVPSVPELRSQPTATAPPPVIELPTLEPPIVDVSPVDPPSAVTPPAPPAMPQAGPETTSVPGGLSLDR